jgi:branched-chain amino acid transport system substrate-binding protein
VPDLYVSTGWSGWGDVVKYPDLGYIPDYVTDARVLTRYINDNLKDKKVAILHENDEFGNDYASGLQETIANKDSPVSAQAADPAPEILRERVLAMRDAGAEVVLSR